LRQIVGTHVLNTSRDARNDAVSNQSTSSAMAGASHRPVLALERLEAAAAQVRYQTSLKTTSLRVVFSFIRSNRLDSTVLCRRARRWRPNKLIWDVANVLCCCVLLETRPMLLDRTRLKF